MPYLPLSLPPGVVRTGTEYQTRGRWWDADLVRWYGDQLGPIGGWRIPAAHAVSGSARAIIVWRTAALLRWGLIGTNTKLYARSVSGTVTDITPAAFVAGNADESANTGYGVGAYGVGAYGTPRPDTGAGTDALTWDMDIYGDQPYACAFSDGRIVSWDLDTSHVAAVVTNAPTSCRGVVVTEQGAIMALGAGGNARKVQWSDLNAPTAWTPSSTNQAGDITLVTQGAIKRAVRLGAQTLILTDIDAHVASYVGLPSVYAFQRVGDDCGLVSKGAVSTMGSQAVWWAKSGFWMFDGGAVVPLNCDIWDYLRANLNPGQRSKITSFHNHQFGEVWWFYPSRGGTECDSYAVYDYRRQHWNIGSMARTCAAESGVFQYPLMVDASGNVYEHEVGWAYDGRTPFAESGPVQLGNGEAVMRVSELISDEATNGEVTVGFLTRAYPNAAETTISDVTFGSDGRAFPRFSARQARVRIDAAANDDWRVGILRLKATQGGFR